MAEPDLLRRAAERASGHGFFLASSLLAYARAEGLDDGALAARLGCDPADVSALLLCRRPTGAGRMFRSDVEAIAARFGLDPARLARLVRAGDAVLSLGRAAPDAGRGLLAAARDREGRPPGSGESPDGPPGDGSAGQSGAAPDVEGGER